jgi:hypothetical protein
VGAELLAGDMAAREVRSAFKCRSPTRRHADTFLPRQDNELVQVRFLPDIKRNSISAGDVAAAGQDQQLNFWIAALEIQDTACHRLIPSVLRGKK